MVISLDSVVFTWLVRSGVVDYIYTRPLSEVFLPRCVCIMSIMLLKDVAGIGLVADCV